MALFMKLALEPDGSPYIQGSCSEQYHQNWIELDHVLFSTRRSVDMDVGNGGRWVWADSQLALIEIVKKMDCASPSLFEHSQMLETIPTVIIDKTHAGDSLQTHLRYTLSNVVIATYETKASSHEKDVKEYLSLGYRRYEMQVTPYDEAGQSMAPVIAGFDITKATLM